MKGSCGLGRCECTCAITSSFACGPVTASTLGCVFSTMSPFAPRQPVTITLPFSASASPIASSDSRTAASMKPQVFTTTRSEPS